MNRLPFLAVALLFGLANIAPAADEPVKGDLARLQGTWVGATGQGGHFQTTFNIKGNLCSFDNVTESGSKIGGASRITLDELAKPHKTIDQTITSRYGGVGRGPEHVSGIYEFIDANTIRICNGFDKRPTDFEGGGNRSFMTFTLTRETEEDRAKKSRGPARAVPPAHAQEPATFEMREFGVVPRPALTQMLVSMTAVQQELKITEAQKKEQTTIDGRRFERIQQAQGEQRHR